MEASDKIIADITEDGTEVRLTGTEGTSLYRFKDTLKTVLGTTYRTKDKNWYMPFEWPALVSLINTFEGTLTFTETLRAKVEELQNAMIQPALDLREKVDADGYEDLYPHQRADVEFLKIARRALLMNGMGAGKTRAAISTLQSLFEDGENVFPALVVGPSATKYPWKKEFEAVWPGLEVTVVDGSAAKRKKQLESPAHVYIMNFEQMRMHSKLVPYGNVAMKKCVECGGEDPKVKPNTCQVHKKELNNMEFSSVIVDEIHRLKDGKSLSTRATKAAAGDADIRIAMSGTPIANTPEDLWSILNFLWPRSFSAKTRFVDRYLVVSQNTWGGTEILGLQPHMQEEFFSIIDPITRRMPEAYVLQHLPPSVYTTREVEMGAKQAKAYKEMKKNMMTELESGLVMVESPLIKSMRLLQFASSYAEVVPGEDITLEGDEDDQEPSINLVLSEPSCKIDAIMEDIESGDFGDDSVVIFAVSRQLIELLSARMEKKGIAHSMITGSQSSYQKSVAIEDFQEGRVQFVLATVAAAGTGITLTRARIAAYLQRSWSNILDKQSEARVRRIGSEIHDSILYIDYITKDTIEPTVFHALRTKDENLQTVLRDDQVLEMIKGA